jgi:mitogen-activated protein kinase kinase
MSTKKPKGPPKLDLNLTAKPKSALDSPSAITVKMQEMSIPENLKLDLRVEDLKTLKELGAGNGGSVSKVSHTPTNKTMARKV